MNILIAHEESQEICKAFRKLGHDAYSCDLQPCSGEHPEWHYQCDSYHAITMRLWDLIIFHPDCTKMSVSGNWIYAAGKPRHNERIEAIEWTIKRWQLVCRHSRTSCLENPVSVLFSHPDMKGAQYIQPYNFGEDASKKTCLLLRNLPPLKPTEYYPPRIVNGKKRWGNQTDSGQNKLGPSLDRGKIRAKTYPGIAAAMADQWGII